MTNVGILPTNEILTYVYKSRIIELQRVLDFYNKTRVTSLKYLLNHQHCDDNTIMTYSFFSRNDMDNLMIHSDMLDAWNIILTRIDKTQDLFSWIEILSICTNLISNYNTILKKVIL